MIGCGKKGKKCKGCSGSKLVKNGRNQLGAQRYKCKDCERTFIEGDTRLKYGAGKAFESDKHGL